METYEELALKKREVQIKNQMPYFTDRYRELADWRKIDTLIEQIFILNFNADLTDDELVDLDKAILTLYDFGSAL